MIDHVYVKASWDTPQKSMMNYWYKKKNLRHKTDYHKRYKWILKDLQLYVPVFLDRSGWNSKQSCIRNIQRWQYHQRCAFEGHDARADWCHCPSQCPRRGVTEKSRSSKDDPYWHYTADIGDDTCESWCSMDRSHCHM